MRNNMLIAGASLASAMAVIGIGVAVSASAMTSEETFDEVTVAIIGFGDGSDDPIQCTFEDVEMPSTLPLPPGVEGNVAVGSISIAGSAPIGAGSGVPPKGTPPDGPTVIVGGGTAPINIQPGEAGSVESGTITGEGPIISFHAESGTAEGGVTEIDGELPPPPPGAVFISSDDVRDGTAEECAALREEMELLAP